MSAIAGIYLMEDRPLEASELDRMVESLSHRGPDGSGLWRGRSVGLVHQMLRTCPKSPEEKLPAESGSADLVITSDARLDNREELLASLGFSGSQGERLSDSELILGAYERWGEECPQHLLGDFAFAIWDGREQALFCARDHVGARPFYYHSSDRLFAFATEIKALTCLSEVPRRLNETKVAEYLVPTQEDKVFTFYRDILRLPPGHYMKVDRKGPRLSQYWCLDPSREIRFGSDEEYSEAFLELFKEAVRCRLRSADPVGSMLSGGLDSSSIACVARDMVRANGGPALKTFSALFDDSPSCDERYYLEQVLAQGGLEPHYLAGDSVGTLFDAERVLFYQDEPYLPMILLIHRALYREARDHGVRVLLDGMDGDSTVSYGLQSFGELARRGRWMALADEVKKYSGFAEAPARMVFWRYGVKPFFPDSLRPLWRRIRGVHRLGIPVSPALRPDFARRVGLEDRLEALHGSLSFPPRSVRDAHYRRLTSGLYPLLLETANKDASGSGVDPRYPFFDKRLLEFCLALPSEQKYSQGWPRVIHRRSLQAVLPKEVAWRWRKASLSAHFRRSMMTSDRQKVEEVIFKHPEVISSYIDVSSLQQTYHNYISDQVPRREGLDVWRAANLGLWLLHSQVGP